MTWADTTTALAAAVGQAFGEAATYTHTGLGASVSLTGVVWGDAVGADAGYGVAVYQREVLIPAALLLDAFGDPVSPRAGGTLTRTPGITTGQDWIVVGANPDPGAWRLTVQRGSP